MKFPFLVFVWLSTCALCSAQFYSDKSDGNTNGTSITNTTLLKYLYGNSKLYGRDAMATYTRTSSDATGVCIIPQKLQFMLTTAKEYSTKFNQFLIAFTSSPLLKNNNCQVPVGALLLKRQGNSWKKLASKPYFINAGASGQGGVYDLVKISNDSYAGLALSEMEDEGISTTTLTIVGALGSELINFTPEPIVISEHNYASHQKPYYYWYAKYSFVPGNGEVYDLSIQISGTKLENGILVDYDKTLVYKYIDDQYQYFGK